MRCSLQLRGAPTSAACRLSEQIGEGGEEGRLDLMVPQSKHGRTTRSAPVNNNVTYYCRLYDQGKDNERILLRSSRARFGLFRYA